MPATAAAADAGPASAPPTALLAEGGPVRGPGWPADPTAATISLREEAVRETGPLAMEPYSLLPSMPPAAASAASLREVISALSLRMESK